MKECKACKIEKDDSAFSKLRDGLDFYCKECKKIKRATYQLKLKENGFIKPREDRELYFWSKVNKTDTCWLWTGSLDSRGYGRYKDGKVEWKAHRYAWFKTNGAIPDEKFLCHQCDVRTCVNPGHLFIGTALENGRDCASKGRERNQKITDQQAIEIYEMYKSGIITREICRKYGITRAQVTDIAHGRSFARLGLQPIYRLKANLLCRYTIGANEHVEAVKDFP